MVQGGSRWFKMVSRWFKMVSRWFHSGFKMVSRWFQSGFKVVSSWFQSGPSGSRWFQSGIKVVQRGRGVGEKAEGLDAMNRAEVASLPGCVFRRTRFSFSCVVFRRRYSPAANRLWLTLKKDMREDQLWRKTRISPISLSTTMRLPLTYVYRGRMPELEVTSPAFQ